MSSDVTMLTDWSIKDFDLAHWAALENVKKGINLGLLTVFSIRLTAFSTDKDLLRNHS